MYAERFLSGIAAGWDLAPVRFRTDLPMAGSPERCRYRVVAESENGNLYLLENAPAARAGHKRRIFQALEHLARRGVPHILPFLRTRAGEPFVEREGGFWMLAPYIPGARLERPAYAFEGWRGPALADFLIALRRDAGEVPGFDPAAPFSIMDFIRDFTRRVTRHDPDIRARVRAAESHLEQAFAARHDRIPAAFCHGDFHPLNVIWAEDGLRAVIDWEFLGYKPELYDAANLVGCLGMEKPGCLTGDLVCVLLERMRVSGEFSREGWDIFFEFVLALRFAWLSEWLRKPDPEMVDLECVYIQLLMENRGRLTEAWGFD